LPATRQLGLLPTLGLWAGLTLLAMLYAAWNPAGSASGTRAFAATLTAFAFYFLVMLLFAARGMESALAARFGANSGYLLGALAFLVYLIYGLGTNTFTFGRAATVAALVLIPLGLATSARGKPAGAWQDFATIIGMWVAVKPFPNRWGFSMAHWIWPFPGGRLGYVLTVLLCVNIALAAFVVLRRVNGIGYSLGWGRHWGFFVLASFIAFGCVAIPLGTGLHFIQFEPQWTQWSTLPLISLGILFFTAWPEELLFRGLLQNMLARASNNDLGGWLAASVLFGLSHLPNGGFPNWRYAILASIAGFFYGWTWRKTGSIFASALVHAAVDITWHFLFRTV
jgi:membrane protease YdiL (CAAX protease family)